jgi:shikimate kinase
MHIYLIGYMGCGKTTAGRKLAKKMGMPFIDLDELIEKHAGKSIRAIFDSEGESAFRELEKQILHQTFSGSDAVISTGGGAPVFFDNMQQMNQQGITVYIQLSAKALLDRLKGATAERPILAGKSEDEMLKFIENALIQREIFYKQASITVNGINLSANSIIRALTIYLP